MEWELRDFGSSNKACPLTPKLPREILFFENPAKEMPGQPD